MLLSVTVLCGPQYFQALWLVDSIGSVGYFLSWEWKPLSHKIWFHTQSDNFGIEYWIRLNWCHSTLHAHARSLSLSHTHTTHVSLQDCTWCSHLSPDCILTVLTFCSSPWTGVSSRAIKIYCFTPQLTCQLLISVDWVVKPPPWDGLTSSPHSLHIDATDTAGFNPASQAGPSSATPTANACVNRNRELSRVDCRVNTELTVSVCVCEDSKKSLCRGTACKTYGSRS